MMCLSLLPATVFAEEENGGDLGQVPNAALKLCTGVAITMKLRVALCTYSAVNTDLLAKKHVVWYNQINARLHVKITVLIINYITTTSEKKIA